MIGGRRPPVMYVLRDGTLCLGSYGKTEEEMNVLVSKSSW